MKLLKLLILILCLYFLQLPNQFTLKAASRGGVNGGGGTDIESLFKTRTIELTKSIAELEEKYRLMLRFSAEELYAAAVAESSFFIKCAPEESEQLKTLKSKNKKAYVFNEEIDAVYLNCSDYKIEDWKKFTDINNNPGNAIFLLHELLRTTDTVNEDNYNYSKDYSKAYFAVKRDNEAKEKELNLKFEQMLTKQVAANNMKCAFSYTMTSNLLSKDRINLYIYEKKSKENITIYKIDDADFYFEAGVIRFLNYYDIAREKLFSSFVKNKCYETE